MTYQKKVLRELKKRFQGSGAVLYEGKWIEFLDSNGRGYAQPDAVLTSPERIVCFEVKLSQCEAGVLQIEELYRPLLREMFHLPVLGILVCKNVTGDPPEGTGFLDDPLEGLRPEGTYVWHWLP